MSESQRYERAQRLAYDIAQMYGKIEKKKALLNKIAGETIKSTEFKLDSITSPISYNLLGLLFLKKAQEATEKEAA